jgi:hypothetical protein
MSERCVARWVLRNSARVIALSQGWIGGLRTIELSAPVTSVFNPVDVPLPDSVYPTATRVLFPGTRYRRQRRVSGALSPGQL